MKLSYYFSVLLLTFITIGCSNSDENTIENGINKAPNQKNTGTSANAFLSSANYSKLIVQVSYVENLRPNQQSLLNLKTFLETRLNKPNGITIVENAIAAQSGSPFSIEKIVAIEDEARTFYNNIDELTLHILFINGGYSEDTNTSKSLGIAYRNTSCVLFEDTIKTLSNQPTEPSRVDLETTVLLHEICHLLGLVDLGSQMQTDHIDNDHGKHCNNSNCLMFWQIENNNVIGMMTGGNIPQLDTNCLQDLQANGGK